MKTAAFLKAYVAHKADAFIAAISSSRFAAAQRRRALAGLDARQLADIGLIYADGDYRPHPDMNVTANALSCPASGRASMPLARARKKDVDGRDKPGHDGGKIGRLVTP
jgi:hypothetical protein